MIELVKLYNHSQDWIHVHQLRRTPDAGPNLAKAAHWGLIEQAPNNDKTKRCSGLWKPTPSGIEFVYKRILVASHVFLYNSSVRGFADGILYFHTVANDLDRRNQSRPSTQLAPEQWSTMAETRKSPPTHTGGH